MKKNIYRMLTLSAAMTLLLAVGAPNVAAQSTLPAGAHPMIVTPHNQTVNYHERTLCLDITANVPFEVASNADWATVRKGSDGSIYLHVQANTTSVSRVATITFTNEGKKLNQTLTLTQTLNESVETAPQDFVVKPSSAKDNQHNGSEDISKTLDGNTSTLYHSPYSGGISEENPAVLTYDFKATERIDYVTYVPRTSGSNGNFGNVAIYVKKMGENNYTLYGEYDFKQSGSPTTIVFGDTGLENPISIQFKVTSGAGTFASCAEMQFCCYNKDAEAEYAIFGDDVFSTLREGVTEEDIANIENDFIRGLATQLYAGDYRKDYRVASYPCLLNVNALSAKWNTPGKLYDQTQGVTGINFGPGKHAVVVSGLPQGKTATLKIIAWYTGIVGGNFDGGDPQEKTFPLHNGLNVIDYQPMQGGRFLNNTYSNDYNGLGYIDYNDYDDPDACPDIKVHFVNGTINGYLTPDLTNEKMHEMTANAPNWCMDLVGRKAHQVWTSQGLNKYCRATDGSLGYRQYMNVIDSLVQWEHDLLGFTKYGHTPENKTFAYVNFTYYMFQGGRGVSFHQNQESRVLNCNRIMYNDYDCIWGLSHEWGHQHQMHPYFSWAGMGEITNNMNSYYNMVHMGYYGDSWAGNWNKRRDKFDNKDYKLEFTDDKTKTYAHRVAAVGVAPNYSYSPKMKSLCLKMEDYKQAGSVPTVAEDPTQAIAYSEEYCLGSFITLYTWATYGLGIKDFGPDLYEALRQTDDENGSQIEKKGEVDKYELIASAQNNNKNGKYAVLAEKYSGSCWIKDNYLNGGNVGTWGNSVPYIMNFCRKTSRLTGYNLFPYFERWGFLRQIALNIGDYGDKAYVMTKEMYDEFKADMEALEKSEGLKPMDEQLVHDVMYYRDINDREAGKMFNTPVIPN